MSLTLRLASMLAALFLALALIGGFGLYRLGQGLQVALAESAGETSRRVVRVLTERLQPLEPSETQTRSVHVFVDGQLQTIDLRGPGDAATDTAAVLPHQFALETALARASGTSIEIHTVLEQGVEPSLRLEAAGMARSIPLPRSGLKRELQHFTMRLAMGLLALLLLGLLASIWLAHRVVAPLQQLAQGAARIGLGERGVQVADGGVREVRETIDAFNAMANQLETLDAETQRLRGQQALAELGEIGRGLAHSLRNPLHSLGLCVDALENQASSAAGAAQLAQTARQQIARLDQNLRGFLALSAGLDAAPELLRVASVVDDVVLEARQTWGDQLHFEISGERDASLLAVAVELRIILHTLLANAAEASPPGTVINIAVEQGDALCIRIDDRGCGIPEHLRAQLFQAHVSSKPQGAGMGLYLAQRLAMLRYAGEISLQPRAGGGTRACVQLQPRLGA